MSIKNEAVAIADDIDSVLALTVPSRDDIRRVMLIAELAQKDVAQALADWLAGRIK